jgi:hypothetical protein
VETAAEEPARLVRPARQPRRRITAVPTSGPIARLSGSRRTNRSRPRRRKRRWPSPPLPRFRCRPTRPVRRSIRRRRWCAARRCSWESI